MTTFFAGGRPPADEVWIEFFIDKKCGRGKTHDAFYNWCADPKPNTNISATCEGVAGSTGICDFTGLFTRSVILRAAANATASVNGTTTASPSNATSTTTPSTITTTQDPALLKPNLLIYNHFCNMGPGKPKPPEVTLQLNSSAVERIEKICYQELHGVSNLPLWLILLIIFLVVLVVGIASSLFYRFWLRRRLYGRQHGEPISAIGSSWTSAPYPVSGVSNISNMGKSKLPSASRLPSNMMARSGSRPASRSRTPSTSSRAASGSGSRVRPSGSSSPSVRSSSRKLSSNASQTKRSVSSTSKNRSNR